MGLAPSSQQATSRLAVSAAQTAKPQAVISGESAGEQKGDKGKRNAHGYAPASAAGSGKVKAEHVRRVFAFTQLYHTHKYG